MNGTGIHIGALINLFIPDQFTGSLSTLVLLMGVNIFVCRLFEAADNRAQLMLIG